MTQDHPHDLAGQERKKATAKARATAREAQAEMDIRSLMGTDWGRRLALALLCPPNQTPLVTRGYQRRPSNFNTNAMTMAHRAGLLDGLGWFLDAIRDLDPVGYQTMLTEHDNGRDRDRNDH